MSKLPNIKELIEDRSEKELLNLYQENKKHFLTAVGSIFVKKDEVKTLEYLESLGMELDDKGHPLLWDCVKYSKPKSTKYLLKYMAKDSQEAIFCNKVIIASAITEDDKNFVKRMKVLPLILGKISLEKYNEIKTDIELNVHRHKGQVSRDKYVAEIDVLYLNQELSKNNKISKIKNKI